MRTYRLDLLTLLGVLLLSAAAPLGAQVRGVVSSQIAVSNRDASLELDFESGESLEIAFRGGEVAVDGEAVGSYERGDALESSWRSLLAEAVQLDDGPLARALVDWMPPTSLEGEAEALGRQIDRTLEERLAAPEPAAASDASRPEAGTGPSPPEQDLAGLLRRTDRLELLAEALEGLELDEVQIRVDENVTVAADEEIQATLVVVDGDLEVSGTVDGDVVVTGGALRVYEGGRITGDVRLADARIYRDGGDIGGTVRTVQVSRERAMDALDQLENLGRLEELEDLEELEGLEEEIRARVRDELRRELRDEIRSELRDRYRGPGIFAPLRSVGRGLSGLLQNLITFAIVVVLGVLVVHFFPENLERVAAAARRSPGRAGMVGVAGTFLLLPIWILGMVALAITIIGIPALLAWVPLFPVAAGLAAGLGYLAVARVLGGWVADQGVQGLDFLRPSNTIHAVAAGVALLMIPYAAANVVEMAGPWLGFVEGLFLTLGWVAGAAAIAVGFGAVLLTRGGREPHRGPADGPYDDLDWTPGTGPTPEPDPAKRPPGRPAPGEDDRWDDEEEWEETWENLEREARDRTSDPPGPEGPEDAGGPAPEPDAPGTRDDRESATGATEDDEDGEDGGPDEGRASDA